MKYIFNYLWKLVINKDDLFFFRKLHCFMLKRSHLKLNWRAYKISQTLWTTYKNFKCSAFTYKLKRVYFKEGYSAVSELCNILRLFTNRPECKYHQPNFWSVGPGLKKSGGPSDFFRPVATDLQLSSTISSLILRG